MSTSFSTKPLRMALFLSLFPLAMAHAASESQSSENVSSLLLSPLLSIASESGPASERLAGESQLVVTSLAEISKGISVLTLQSAKGSRNFSLRVAADTAKALKVAAGTTLSVTAESVGYALYVSGKILAFVPNRAAEALLFHHRIPEADE